MGWVCEASFRKINCYGRKSTRRKLKNSSEMRNESFSRESKENSLQKESTWHANLTYSYDQCIIILCMTMFVCKHGRKIGEWKFIGWHKFSGIKKGIVSILWDAFLLKFWLLKFWFLNHFDFLLWAQVDNSICLHNNTTHIHTRKQNIRQQRLQILLLQCVGRNHDCEK